MSLFEPCPDEGEPPVTRNFRLFLCVAMGMLLPVSLMCGCAGQAFKRDAIPPEQTLLNLSRAVTQDERMTAAAHLDIMTPQGHYPARAAIILQKPSCLRLELLPVIGTPDFILTADAEALNIFIPSRGEFYKGLPSADNLARFLPWRFTIDDLVRILAGDTPALPESRIFSARDAGETVDHLVMKATTGVFQVVRFDARGRLASVVRYGADGKPVYSIDYEEYKPSARLASRISIRLSDQTLALSVTYATFRIEKAADLSVFRLAPPAGIRIVEMD